MKILITKKSFSFLLGLGDRALSSYNCPIRTNQIADTVHVRNLHVNLTCLKKSLLLFARKTDEIYQLAFILKDLRFVINLVHFTFVVEALITIIVPTNQPHAMQRTKRPCIQLTSNSQLNKQSTN